MKPKVLIILHAIAILFFLSISAHGTNYETVKSGLWTDSSVWKDNEMPDFNKKANILINYGHSITHISEDIMHMGQHTTIFIDSLSSLIVTHTINVNHEKNDTIEAIEAEHHLVVDVHEGGIFIINGDITTTKHANITVNGEIDVNGNFTMGDNADLIVNGDLNITGDLTIGENSTFEGDGSVDVGGEVNVPEGFPLPIELSYFTATANNTSVDLVWETASETNNDFFTIEHSTNGLTFNELEQINGAGNSFNPINYQASHNNPQMGINYYRLKQTDFDGQYSYSPIESVNYTPEAVCQVYPNPFRGNINIKNTGSEQEFIIQVISTGGQIVHQQKSKAPSQSIDLSNLTKGMYILSINSQSQHINKRIQKL